MNIRPQVLCCWALYPSSGFSLISKTGFGFLRRWLSPRSHSWVCWVTGLLLLTFPHLCLSLLLLPCYILPYGRVSYVCIASTSYPSLSWIQNKCLIFKLFYWHFSICLLLSRFFFQFFRLNVTFCWWNFYFLIKISIHVTSSSMVDTEILCETVSVLAALLSGSC